MARKVADWIDSFVQYTEVSGSPERFRRWGAISTIAGALEKKTWVFTSGANLYPNLYVFLISPPGIGKSRVLAETYRMWTGIPDHKTSVPSVTKASLIDELVDAHRTVIRAGHTPSTVEFNSLKVVISELGVFLSEYANDFMNTLTDLYDGYPYGERRRTKNLQISIPNPQLNLLAGTTPSYLNNLIPEGAWDQGFLSRTILVYDDARVLRSMFAQTSWDRALGKELQTTINHIGSLYGEFTFTPEAAAMIDEWYLGGQNPRPNHPKLQNYLVRRPVHLLKLCQVAAANSSDTLVIDVPHVQLAFDWLLDAELYAPEIFKAMVSGGDSKVMEEAWHLCFQYKMKHQKGLPHALMIKFMSMKVPSYKVEQLVDLMEKSNMIRAVAVKGEGTTYEPRDKAFL